MEEDSYHRSGLVHIKSDFALSLRHWPSFVHWDFRCRASVVSDIAFHFLSVILSFRRVLLVYQFPYIAFL
jgi:hypothetical protein